MNIPPVKKRNQKNPMTQSNSTKVLPLDTTISIPDLSHEGFLGRMHQRNFKPEVVLFVNESFVMELYVLCHLVYYIILGFTKLCPTIHAMFYVSLCIVNTFVDLMIGWLVRLLPGTLQPSLKVVTSSNLHG